MSADIPRNRKVTTFSVSDTSWLVAVASEMYRDSSLAASRHPNIREGLGKVVVIVKRVIYVVFCVLKIQDRAA